MPPLFHKKLEHKDLDYPRQAHCLKQRLLIGSTLSILLSYLYPDTARAEVPVTIDIESSGSIGIPIRRKCSKIINEQHHHKEDAEHHHEKVEEPIKNSKKRCLDEHPRFGLGVGYVRTFEIQTNEGSEESEEMDEDSHTPDRFNFQLALRFGKKTDFRLLPKFRLGLDKKNVYGVNKTIIKPAFGLGIDFHPIQILEFDIAGNLSTDLVFDSIVDIRAKINHFFYFGWGFNFEHHHKDFYFGAGPLFIIKLGRFCGIGIEATMGNKFDGLISLNCSTNSHDAPHGMH